jgi:hypothetical protein
VLIAWESIDSNMTGLKGNPIYSFVSKFYGRIKQGNFARTTGRLINKCTKEGFSRLGFFMVALLSYVLKNLLH